MLVSLSGMEALHKKYDRELHHVRFARIAEKWDEIVRIIDEELPSLEMLDALYQMLHLPIEPPEDGILKMTVKAGKDIRDKYVLPRLLWDLGVLDEFCDTIGD